MYQALYRKWRPRVFEDVAGQEAITRTLKNELRAGRVGHAYLFTGSRGTGKTTCAKILAKAVNCLDPQDGDPCGKCSNCLGIDSGSLTDVVEIDAASNNGVDNIRELREEAGYTPAAAKYRVYIIDEAHMLSTGAFNALLKTLEEPPAYVIFILATTEVHKVPATILSRCQRFDFKRIPTEDIAHRLSYVAQQEELALTEDGAALIARLSDGALRDALSLLDQCAGTKGEIDEAAVSAAAGLTGGEYLEQMAQAVLAQDGKAALCVVDNIYAASKDSERFCEELLDYFRSLLVVRTVGDTSLLNVTASREQTLKEQAQQLSKESLLHLLTVLEDTLERLHKTPLKRVELELGVLRLCTPELDDSPAAMLRRIKALEEKLAAAPLAASPVKAAPARPVQKETAPPPAAQRAAPVPQDEPQAAPEQEQPPAAQSAAPDEPLDCWPEVLMAIQKSDPPFSGFLNGSSAVLHGEHVLVDAPNPMFPDLIREQSHRKALIECIRAVTGKPYKVGVFKKSLQAAPKNDSLDELLDAAAAQGVPVEIVKHD